MSDDELKAMLAKLVAKIDEFRIEVRTELRVINEHLAGIDKRLDEQGRYIAALIPTRLAAVPATPEERRTS
ncbi:MAG: hypothetical protein WCF85_16845 [Rhodospirillaceae bacterium]